MASRVIQIEIKGEGGSYEATINRIIEKNRQLNRDAIAGAQQTAAALQNANGVTVTLTSSFATLGRTIAAAFPVVALIGFVKHVVDVAGQIDDLSKKTGFARQTLSGIKSTIEENGSTLESFATAVNKAQKSLGDIDGAGKDAGATLKAMGLDVDQLVKASPEKFFEKFAEALSKVENQNQRVAIATKVMGKAGAEQIPVVLELAEKFQQLRKEGVNDETIKLIDGIGDAFTRLSNETIKNTQREIKTLIDLFDRIFKFSDKAKATSEASGASDALANIDKQITNTRTASGFMFGLFNSPEERERRRQEQLLALQQKRVEASAKLYDAQDKLLQITNRDADKPLTGAPNLNLSPGDANKSAEAIAKSQTDLLKLNLAQLEAARSSGALSKAMLDAGLAITDLDDKIKEASIALIEQEKNAQLAAAAHDKILTPALKAAIEQEAKAKIAAFEASEETKKRKDALELAKRAADGDAAAEKNVADALDASGKNQKELNQQALDSIEITKKLGELEADRLEILGKTNEAEQLRLQVGLKYLEAKKLIDQQTPGGTDTRVIEAQIQNAQTQLQKLGTVTVDIGKHVGDTLNDIFTGLISGTLKGVDVGKSAMATIGRIATDIFSQVIKNKLSFELQLFTNVRGLPQQLNSAAQTGASSLPSGGILSTLFGGNGNGGNSGGGILSSLFGGGGGGGGGILSSLFNNVSSLFGSFFGGGGAVGSGGLIGFGSAPAGVAGPLFANGGFFSSALGSLSNGIGTALSSVSSLFSSIPFIGPLIAILTPVVIKGIASMFSSGGLFSSTPNLNPDGSFFGDGSFFSSDNGSRAGIVGTFLGSAGMINGNAGGFKGGLGTLFGMTPLIANSFSLASVLKSGQNPAGAIINLLTNIFEGAFGSGNIIAFLVNLLTAKAPPRTTGTAESTLEGLKLGDFGLELGKISTTFSAKGNAAKKLNSADVAKSIEEIANNSAQAILNLVNKMPLEVLKQLDLPGLTARIENASSFKLNVKDGRFGSLLRDNINSIPARMMDAFAPVISSAIELELKRLDIDGSGASDFVKRIIAPSQSSTLKPDEWAKMTDENLTAFGSFFDFLNQLEQVRKFTSAPESAALGAGAQTLLDVDKTADIEPAIKKYTDFFQGIFANAASRQKIAESIGQAITDGINGVDPSTAFQNFRRGFSDVITQTVQDAMVNSFVMQKIAPLITGPVARIQDIFGNLGENATPADFAAAQQQAQGEVAGLSGQLLALAPVFNLFRDTLAGIVSNIQATIGVPNQSTTPANQITGPVTLNLYGIQNVGELARQLEEFLSGGTSPSSLQ